MWVKAWGLICLFCYIRLIICKKSEICEEGSFFKKASWYCIPTTSHYIIQLIWVKESTVQRSHKSQAKHPHIQGDCSTKSGRKKWLHHYMLHPWSKKKMWVNDLNNPTPGKQSRAEYCLQDIQHVNMDILSFFTSFAKSKKSTSNEHEFQESFPLSRLQGRCCRKSAFQL